MCSVEEELSKGCFITNTIQTQKVSTQQNLIQQNKYLIQQNNITNQTNISFAGVTPSHGGPRPCETSEKTTCENTVPVNAGCQSMQTDAPRVARCAHIDLLHMPNSGLGALSRHMPNTVVEDRRSLSGEPLGGKEGNGGGDQGYIRALYNSTPPLHPPTAPQTTSSNKTFEANHSTKPTFSNISTISTISTSTTSLQTAAPLPPALSSVNPDRASVTHTPWTVPAIAGCLSMLGGLAEERQEAKEADAPPHWKLANARPYFSGERGAVQNSDIEQSAATSSEIFVGGSAPVPVDPCVQDAVANRDSDPGRIGTGLDMPSMPFFTFFQQQKQHQRQRP